MQKKKIKKTFLILFLISFIFFFHFIVFCVSPSLKAATSILDKFVNTLVSLLD